jgi:poly(3-hydroxybutyrate) depolymerase
MKNRLGIGVLALLAACGGGDNEASSASVGNPGATSPAQEAAGSKAAPAATSGGNSATPSTPTSMTSRAGSGAAGTTAAPSGGDVMQPASGGAPAAAVSGGTPATGAAGAAGSGEPTTADAADPSEGCGGGTLMPGESTKMLMSGGSMHVYVQHVPDKYDGKTPMPIVLDLHGGSYDGPRWVDASGFKTLGDTEGFITLFPSGTDNSWLATEAMSSDGQFLKDLLAEFFKTGCIDKKRIYSTGCSMGGAMSFWMGCFASDLIAAIAPMCGTPFFDLDMCKPTRPLPMILTIGETDNLNCWDGMPSGIGNPCAMQVFDYFKGLDMCTGDARDLFDGACHTYETCAAGSEVTVCKSNTGHGVYQATNFDVTPESWKFLKRFHL